MSSDPTELEKQPWHDLEAKSLMRANEQSLAKVQGGGLSGSWNEWVAKDLAQGDWVIEDLPLSAYQLPVSARAFIGDDLVGEWSELTTDIHQVHNQLVGMKQSLAGAILAGDERVESFKVRSRRWVDAYVIRRISKTLAKTGGSIKQFQLLVAELLPQIEAIAYRAGSANKWLMGEFTDYLPARVLDLTCKNLIETRFEREKMAPTYRVICGNPLDQLYLAELVQLYQWHHFTDLPNVLGLLESASKGSVNALSEEAIRKRLQHLVEDIQEMRPFLRHNFRPENVVVELMDGIIASFSWTVGIGVGFIGLAPSVDAMMKHHRDRTSGLALAVGYDGILANLSSPWITTDSLLNSQPKALLANLYMLEAIHTRLFELYSKVDLEPVLRRFRAKNADVGAAVVDASEEEFAAICQMVADPVAEVLPEAQGSEREVRVGGIRVQKLMAILADKLGCEVRQGKGSEIVVYRPGGHHFRLGHHKRNTHVPPFLIRSLLERVGITLNEWVAAVGV